MTRKYKNIAKRWITFYSFFRKLNQKKKNSTPTSSESLLAHWWLFFTWMTSQVRLFGKKILSCWLQPTRHQAVPEHVGRQASPVPANSNACTFSWGTAFFDKDSLSDVLSRPAAEFTLHHKLTLGLRARCQEHLLFPLWHIASNSAFKSAVH